MARSSVESTNLLQKHPGVVKELKGLLAEYVNKGRSTPGSVQENDPAEKDWKQIEVVKEFLKK